jgi:hypothetical protein
MYSLEIKDVIHNILPFNNEDFDILVPVVLLVSYMLITL